MTVSYDRIFTHDDATSLLQKQTDIKNSIDALTTAVTNNTTNYVDKSTAQSIDGVKTFTSSPVVPTPTDSDNSTKAATTAFIENTFFGKLVTHLAASTAATISSLSTDSLFYRMLSCALTASGVQYNLTNSSAWYIKLGSLFGGLIIQGGYATNVSTSNTTISYPISFSGLPGVCATSSTDGGYVKVAPVNSDDFVARYVGSFTGEKWVYYLAAGK